MFVLEGVSLWVINEVSNTNKHLRIVDEKNQYNMRTAEETTCLALVSCSSKTARYFSSVFRRKINLDQNSGHWELRRILIRLLKLGKWRIAWFSSRQVQEEFHAISCFPLHKSNFSSVYA